MIYLRERGKFVGNPVACRDQVGHDAFVHVEGSLVLGDVAHVVALV